MPSSSRRSWVLAAASPSCRLSPWQRELRTGKLKLLKLLTRVIKRGIWSLAIEVNVQRKSIRAVLSSVWRDARPGTPSQDIHRRRAGTDTHHSLIGGAIARPYRNLSLTDVRGCGRRGARRSSCGLPPRCWCSCASIGLRRACTMNACAPPNRPTGDRKRVGEASLPFKG